MADTQSNRGHRGFHRGRRGPDRRGGGQRPSNERGGDRGDRQERGGDRGDRGERGERQGRGQDERPQAGPPVSIRTENADVAQIMRDIKARVAQKHGITLSDQQVEELAARRLEAVLDVRGISPDLLEQLRRAAGGRVVEVPSGPEAPSFQFEEDTIYETPRGLLRSLRRLFNPLLKLLFNPEPLIGALNTQTRINAAAAAREGERTRAQAEWNALHYALLQRLVSEIAKLSLENQALAQQVESLSAKVDFSDRRVRGLEGAQHQVEVRTSHQQGGGGQASRSESGFSAAPPSGPGGGGDSQTGDGPRRKRRRRRGRKPGGADGGPGMGAPADGSLDGGLDDDGGDEIGGDDGGEDTAFELAAGASAEAPSEAPVTTFSAPAVHTPSASGGESPVAAPAAPAAETPAAAPATPSAEGPAGSAGDPAAS